MAKNSVLDIMLGTGDGRNQSMWVYSRSSQSYQALDVKLVFAKVGKEVGSTWLRRM